MSVDETPRLVGKRRTEHPRQEPQGIRNGVEASLHRRLFPYRLPIHLAAPHHQIKVLEPAQPLVAVAPQVNAKLHEQVVVSKDASSCPAEAVFNRAGPNFVHPHWFEPDLQMITVKFHDVAGLVINEDSLEDAMATVQPVRAVIDVLVVVAPLDEVFRDPREVALVDEQVDVGVDAQRWIRDKACRRAPDPSKPPPVHPSRSWR